jgi:hypothetical protein
LSHSSTVDVSADFQSAPLPPENLARLRALLFGPDSDADDRSDEPTCGFDAACERAERHLRWFERDARMQGVVA